MSLPPERLERLVVCAAVRFEDGTVVLGVRHFDPIMTSTIFKMGIYEMTSDGNIQKNQPPPVQGFVDQRGVFMTRAQAWDVAKASGQLRRGTGGGETLYSEDLY